MKTPDVIAEWRSAERVIVKRMKEAVLASEPTRVASEAAGR